VLRILISSDLDEKYVTRIRFHVPASQVVKSAEMSILLTAISDADILLAGRFTREMFLRATRLRWIQTEATGVDRFLFPELVSSDVVLTNARGAHAAPVSDHALAMILSFSRSLHRFTRFQFDRRWKKLHCDELQYRTIGIVGLGSIGLEIARKAACFGMKIVALDRNVQKPTFVEELYQPTDLHRLLERSDFVVLAVPLTRDSEGMIGEEELLKMKKSAVLINISRGRLVREGALTKALKEGRIAGAGLDVFEEEPLPSRSELWDLENVIVTPHVAGATPHDWRRVCDIFCENLTRYLSNRTLVNVVDKNVGY
jgi:phosphoglycerate dehydrogenase-like enzyme